MSIRLQLLIVALTTLILPWAGCQYAHELENAMRVSQERGLESSADIIAHALSAEPQRVFGDAADPQPFSPQQGDLYVFPLHSPPLLDGYREDWDLSADPTPLPSAAGDTLRVQAGSTARYLFLYLEIEDAHYRGEPANAPAPDYPFDRVELTVERADGSREAYVFATPAQGAIEAQTLVNGDDGVDRAASEPRIQAFWLQTSRGYHLEARIPLSLVGPRLWIEARDGAGGKSGLSASDPAVASDPGSASDPARGGRLFMTTPGLNELLGNFVRAGTRATVLDANALKLGVAGSVGEHAGAADEDGDSAGSWYRHFVTVDTSAWPLQVSLPDRMMETSVASALGGHPAAEWLRAGGSQEPRLAAAAPIVIDGRVRGAVVLEQAGDQLLDLRDQALTHLFNLTLFATALAVLFAFSVAAMISVRIGRLRAAADTAVGNDGRIRLDMPESQRADEIGDLARGFERLLARLNEHTQYLRTLGGKLSHELRTPLTIVRSSLDNLESEGARADQRGYLTRAREGVLRLQSILTALGAAARVEESIKQAERVNFDLKELLSSATAGYRDAFPGVRFELDTPQDSCFLRGAPDLIVQMLDKLIENAVDYCPASGLITVRLARSEGRYELSVSNDGPPIPPDMLGRLFESLFEHRQGRDDKPHFGLGLYIVRLIAEFHDGRALAANRAGEAGDGTGSGAGGAPAGGSGAIFTVVLPLI